MPSSPYTNNQPQPSKSTNIVPVKGMISVEDLENDHSYMSPTLSNNDTKDYFNNRSTPIDNHKVM
jgi:hypothetical protein